MTASGRFPGDEGVSPSAPETRQRRGSLTSGARRPDTAGVGIAWRERPPLLSKTWRRSAFLDDVEARRTSPCRPIGVLTRLDRE